jgi:hypothetical protein
MIDHLPEYWPDAGTSYRIRIVVEGSVTWVKHIPDLETAQRAYVNMRDNLDLGASQFSSGEVFDEMGQHIARISYNGRLWPAGPWSPETEPLAEAPKTERI